MKKQLIWIGPLLIALFLFFIYSPQPNPIEVEPTPVALKRYGVARLNMDFKLVKRSDRAMIPLLIQAATQMDRIYWLQYHGDPAPLFKYASSPELRLLLESNHGPWDKLNNLNPLIEGVEAQPPGANFYPADLTKKEWKAFADPKKADPYHLIQRTEAGELQATPYHQAFARELKQAAQLLTKAAQYSSNPEFAQYLKLRAQALTTDDFTASDRAWVLLDKNPIDFIIGPIETYDDGLYGSKTAYEALLLVKDLTWDAKLKKWEGKLPGLQQRLPVPAEYRSETPGPAAGLGAYDLWYATGQANSGPKALALNLPNDPKIQLEVGSRRLQLKNVMAAKYEQILKPIAELLLVPPQAKKVSFEAFFTSTMLHEVAHGLGIKKLVKGEGSVKEALKEYADDLEEDKAELLALFFIAQLIESGELSGDLESYYATFTADMLRTMRFGLHSAHGRAALARWNELVQRQAISEIGGRFEVHVPQMKQAIRDLTHQVLLFQGNGDRLAVKAWLEKMTKPLPALDRAIALMKEEKIQVDIRFIQGFSK